MSGWNSSALFQRRSEHPSETSRNFGGRIGQSNNVIEISRQSEPQKHRDPRALRWHWDTPSQAGLITPKFFFPLIDMVALFTIVLPPRPLRPDRVGIKISSLPEEESRPFPPPLHRSIRAPARDSGRERPTTLASDSADSRLAQVEVDSRPIPEMTQPSGGRQAGADRHRPPCAYFHFQCPEVFH